MFSLKFLVLFTIFSSTQAFAWLDQKPVHLCLKAIRSNNPDPYLAHVEGGAFPNKTRASFVGDKNLTDLNKNLAMSLNENAKIYCDGNYDLDNDSNGIQIITVKSLKLCIDENGSIVASSMGENVLSSDLKELLGSLNDYRISQQNPDAGNREVGKDSPTEKTPNSDNSTGVISEK